MLYKAMVTEKYLAEYDFQAPICSRPVKDFTLTNVRQSATVLEIKKAVEKLKGFRMECQNLTLVDEEQFMNAQDPIRVQILQETLEQLKKELGENHN